MNAHIHIGIGDPDDTAKEFIHLWKRAESGEQVEPEHRLCFENIETLLKILEARLKLAA